MWVHAEYEATTLFSLKPASATSSGGRTLLVPTPFAIKMAILDVVCRIDGVDQAEQVMDWLSPAKVALRPPNRVVVNNTFIKVLRPRRNPAKPGSRDAGYFQKTIAYREYAYFGDKLSIALDVTEAHQIDALKRYLLHINYLGKRGSFMQIQREPDDTPELPADFITVDETLNEDGFSLNHTLLQLDDTSPDLTFKQANIYTSGAGASITLGKDRLLKQIVLPYQLRSSSRGYSFYEVVRDD